MAPVRPSTLLLLLLCSCCAMAGAGAQRTLMATAPNCSSIHSACTSCSTQKTATANVLRCTNCTAPYVLYNTATTSACACAPGWYTKTENPSICLACPADSYCKGGVRGAATKVACGTCLRTPGMYAQNASACITKAGCGYKASDGTAALCPAGSYSSGGTKQPCTPCPAGLTTSSTGSDTIDKCGAPPGTFYVNTTRQALPCPKGTFKTGINKASACTPCPDGLTTASTKSMAATACSIATPGHRPVVVDGVVVGVEDCPPNTYGTDGTACLPCPNGLQTETAASTSSGACKTGPGFGWYATGLGDNNPVTTAALNGAKIIQCPAGSYKAGWNLNPCISCGTGVLTDTSRTEGLGVSSDDCYIPAGWGSLVTSGSTRNLVAKACKAGKFGVAAILTGIQPHPCQPCPANTVTADQIPGFVDPPDVVVGPDGCFAKPGFGWDQGVATACPVGTYKEAFSTDACTPCGEGLTTLATASTHAFDCVTLPGWERVLADDNFATVCVAGFYASGQGDTCHPCPKGSTPLYPAATAVSACRVCAPGWGLNADQQCQQCAQNTFGPVDGACVPCGADQVSPVGSSDSSDCYDRFTSPAPYDTLTTPAAAWTSTSSAASADASACMAACASEALCQYYIWRSDQDPMASSLNGCFFKTAPADGAEAADTYTAIKAATGDYIVWKAASDEYGFVAAASTPFASGSTTTPWDCLDGCDSDASCLAVFITKVAGVGWSCWQVDGDFALGTVVSAVKANPDNINAFWWGDSP